MSSAATIWQLRLETHFKTLATKAKSVERPIFAIEHGLSAIEIEELQSVARAELVLNGLCSAHWLLWVVYATEYGYRFNGLQFWEDFSDQTPLWYLRGDRNQIRNWFHRFHSDFGGIKPGGKWASHFSIISWPITHAILPKDLQRRLARAIYEAQYDLRRVVGRPYLEVGWALANTVYEGSQRFLLLLEQEELVGQIVVSLLGNIDETAEGIEPVALSRIKQDLSAMHDARAWLKQAQQTWRSCSPHFKISGRIGRSADVTHSPNESIALPHKISPIPAIEAQQLSADVWQFELTVPSFGDIAALKPEFRDFLRNTRVCIPVAETPMLPGGWLLTGVRKRALKSWPTTGEGLLQFEISPPFGGLVDWDLAIPNNNNVWVFKIQSDGTGRLMHRNELRAGHSYLIATISDYDINTLTFASPCTTECRDISIYRLDLPKLIPPDLHASLKKQGLQCIQSIILSAAGIPPLQWDEELGGEWLSTTRPMLSIKRDHDFEGYQFSLDGCDIVEVPNNHMQQTLIELPYLSPGKHNIAIQTFTNNGGHSNTAKHIHADLQFQITIRDPKPWIAGTSNYPGMFVTYHPLNPSIEDFLAGHINLDVLGENDVISSIAIVLKDSSGEEVLRRSIVEHTLPISHQMWEKSYQTFLHKNAESNEYYLCNSAYLEVSSREYGCYKINLERHFAPIRWLLTYKHDIPFMRLIEHGASEGIETSFSNFSSPLLDTSFTPSELQHGLQITQPGGLFRAIAGEIFTDAVYAPIDIKGLTALHVPFDEETLKNINDCDVLLERAAVWHRATPLTHLAQLWRKQLVKSLFDRVISQFCGRRWLKAERVLHGCPQAEASWETLESIVLDTQSYGLAVGKANFMHPPSILQLKTRLYDITQRHGIKSGGNFFALAWKLAWFDETYEPLTMAELEAVVHYGCVIRAARLLRLRFLYHRFNLVSEKQ